MSAAVAAAEPAGAAGAPPAAVSGGQRPLLAQLNREAEALYGEVRGGLLRVQLPPPRWLDEESHEQSPLTKYKELDPKVRQALARGHAAPASRPSASDADVKLDANALIVITPPGPAPEGSDSAFTPNNVGLLLDEKRHVLVPLYVERGRADERPIRLAGADGRVTPARFVGSDRQTNLTVLQLAEPAGTPLRLADDERVADGSLVMLVTPHDASARVGLWTGGAREFAVVFSVDGRCAGIARFGQFLSGRACRLIAEQIIRHGSVKRATLGVIITEIRRDDPVRQKLPALADRNAMRIDQVMPASAAEAAGLRAGDLLLAVAGEAVNDIPGLSAAIAACDGPTALQVLRDDQVLAVTVDLRQK